MCHSLDTFRPECALLVDREFSLRRGRRNWRQCQRGAGIGLSSVWKHGGGWLRHRLAARVPASVHATATVSPIVLVPPVLSPPFVFPSPVWFAGPLVFSVPSVLPSPLIPPPVFVSPPIFVPPPRIIPSPLLIPPPLIFSPPIVIALLIIWIAYRSMRRKPRSGVGGRVWGHRAHWRNLSVSAETVSPQYAVEPVATREARRPSGGPVQW